MGRLLAPADLNSPQNLQVACQCSASYREFQKQIVGPEGQKHTLTLRPSPFSTMPMFSTQASFSRCNV